VKPLIVAGLEINANILGPARGPRCEPSQCRAACCANGIWVDEGLADRIRAEATTVAALLPPERADPDAWFEPDEEMLSEDFPSGRGIPTAVVDDPDDPDGHTCVFLRPGDRLCALHMANGPLGLAYPGLKPFDCATYPVLRSEGELLMDEESPDELDGADCQRAAAGQRRRLIDVFRDEITLCLGEDGWEALNRHVK
jgi:hypothetical protein